LTWIEITSTITMILEGISRDVNGYPWMRIMWYPYPLR